MKHSSAVLKMELTQAKFLSENPWRCRVCCTVTFPLVSAIECRRKWIIICVQSNTGPVLCSDAISDVDAFLCFSHFHSGQSNCLPR